MISAAGFLLLLALVYAPWALGCVQPATLFGLEIIAFSSLALWTAGLIAQRRFASIPHFAAACIVLLLAQGWWMILNAHGLYDGGRILPIDAWWPIAPGAVDGPVCQAMMMQITAVLALLLVACDLGKHEAWRWRMIVTLAGAAVSIAAWGLLQKAGVLPALAEREYPESVFATFDYHGNAGAFLNLGIPAAFALAVYFNRAGGAAALLICVAAALVNISRAGAAISILLSFILVGWSRALRAGGARRSDSRVAAGFLIAFVALTLAAGGAAWRRWNTLESMEIGNNPRLIMLKIAGPMAVDAGVFGYGPGSFKLIYPDSPHMRRELYERWKVQPYMIGKETSIYSYVHNDFMQFVIEWGWFGAAVWLTLLATAVAAGVNAYRFADAGRRLTIVVSFAALGGVMTHALVDWPLQVASLQLDVAVYLALLLSCASS